MVYAYPDGREAAFDIHTSWVTPDNFPGYVEQEVQFRFDNGVWNAHQRKRGVEVTVEGQPPGDKIHAQSPLQRAPSSSRGASAANAATAWRSFGVFSRRWRLSNSAARPTNATSACSG